MSAHWQRGSLEHATLIGPRLLHLQMSTSGNGDLGMWFPVGLLLLSLSCKSGPTC